MTNGMISILRRQLSFITNFTCICVYISQLIRYARACSTYDPFLVRGSLLTKKLMSQGFYRLVYTSSVLQVLWSLQRSSMSLQPSCRPNAVWCVSYQSLSRWYTDLDYGSNRLPELELWLTAGVTGRQGMFTTPMHLIPPLVYPEVRVCPILWFVFPTGLWDWWLFFIYANIVST
jgi:hypothetical protein